MALSSPWCLSTSPSRSCCSRFSSSSSASLSCLAASASCLAAFRCRSSSCSARHTRVNSASVDCRREMCASFSSASCCFCCSSRPSASAFLDRSRSTFSLSSEYTCENMRSRSSASVSSPPITPASAPAVSGLMIYPHVLMALTHSSGARSPAGRSRPPDAPAAAPPAARPAAAAGSAAAPSTSRLGPTHQARKKAPPNKASQNLHLSEGPVCHRDGLTHPWPGVPAESAAPPTAAPQFYSIVAARGAAAA